MRGTVRWRRYLDWIIKKHYRGDLLRMPRFVRSALRVAIYQMLFLSQVPDYAAVNEAVSLVKERVGEDWSRRVNAVLRAVQRREQRWPEPQSTDLARRFAIRWSHPDWLVERWLGFFGEQETVELLRANNEPPPLTIRVNEAKVSVDRLREQLLQKGIEAEPVQDFPGFLQVDTGGHPIDELTEFREGAFTAQDPSGSLAIRALGLRSGDCVFDLCAAPGGKATAIAEQVGAEGLVVAADKHVGRLRRIAESAARLGATQLRLVAADALHPPFTHAGKVLLDVPCSGTGVLRRRVDLRWQRTPGQIAELARLQRSMLEACSALQTEGDIIVYSTCTLEPEENEHVIKDFLDDHPEYEVEPMDRFISTKFCTPEGFARTYPHKHKVDGVFVARLVRKR